MHFSACFFVYCFIKILHIMAKKILNLRRCGGKRFFHCPLFHELGFFHKEFLLSKFFFHDPQGFAEPLEMDYFAFP